MIYGKKKKNKEYKKLDKEFNKYMQKKIKK